MGAEEPIACSYPSQSGRISRKIKNCTTWSSWRDKGQFVSEKFQWLPADLHVGSDGRRKLLSYINNMHPEWHAPLYAATANLIESTLPLFEKVLGQAPVPPRRAFLIEQGSRTEYTEDFLMMFSESWECRELKLKVGTDFSIHA